MARLRYLQNKRSGTAGTIVKSTTKLHFYDDGMYIYASADGVLEIVSNTTLTLTAPTINIASSTVTAYTYPVTITYACTDSAVSCLTITSDSASTTGGTTILPLYVDATMSGDGGVGRAIEGKLSVTGSLASWGNAIKGYTDITVANGTTGIVSAVCAELKLPSATLTTGMYAVLELEWVGQTSTNTQGVLQGVHTSLIYANVGGGTAGDFDSNGYIFEIEGLSDSTGNAYYDDTLRIAVGNTAKYIPLSTAQGSFTTSYAITSNCTTDSDSTTTGAIQTDGGLGVLLKSNFGGFMVASQDTGTTDYPTGLNETLTITGNSAGSVAALRALAVMGGTSKTTMNIWGISCAARLKHAADYAGGTMAALLAGVDLHASTTADCYVYGIQIDFTNIYSNRAASPMAFMCFTDYEPTTKPASYVFDFGGMSDRISTGSGKLYHNNSLKVKVHSDDRYIPLLTAQDDINVMFGACTVDTYVGAHYASGSGSTEQPTFIFQAPAVCHVVGCYITTSSDDPTSSSDYWSWNIYNKTQTEYLLSSWMTNDSGAGGTAITAWVPYAITPDQNQTLAANDVLQLIGKSSSSSSTRVDNVRSALIYSYDSADAE